MKMPDILTNTSASLPSSPRLAKIDLGDVAWLSLFALVGMLVILRPLFVLGCLGVAAAVGFCWLVIVSVRRAGLELWQLLALIALSGYLLLNYGFENLTIHVGGFPIIISYGLMYASFALAVSAHRHLIAKSLKEPAVLCAIALLVLALFHLVVDIPRYGVMALRDSSMCLDAIFLLLGMLWAMKRNGGLFLAKWLTVVFALNMMYYNFTFPWAEKVWSWSPQSGVFQKVPLLGNYSGTGDILLAGALFCICVGGYVVRRPRWMMPLLVAAQFLGVAIAQVRRMYVATVIVIIILVLLGETKKYAKLLILLPSAITVLLLATTLGGIEISGRIGPVSLDFFREHIRSISTSEGTPGSSVDSRFIMVNQAFQHFLAHPVVGEGFGLPLLNVIDETNGAVSRMPHNSSVTYLARLGVIGFAVWVAFHFCLIKRFIYSLRQRRACGDERLSAFVLWLFLFYVLFMIASLVEGPFEFPSAAVPFYFLMGFALGLMRWHLSDKNRSEQRLGPFVSIAVKASSGHSVSNTVARYYATGHTPFNEHV